MSDSGTFATRLQSLGPPSKRLCVGLDPHPEILLEWGLPDTAEGVKRFGEVVIDSCLEQGIALVKPQVAFFERHGVAGMSALSQLMGAAREASLVVISDAKRGDVGSTVAGYADAWLSPGSDFESDAVTAVAYQGVASLTPMFEAALTHGRGVFVLVNTSNPDGWALQKAIVDNSHTVAQEVYSGLVTYQESSGASHWLGAVVGATLPAHSRAVSVSDDLWLLAPGFGHQGAKLADLEDLFAGVSHRVIPTVSRSVTGDGPDRVAALISTHLAECQS